ncbi:recombinase family protein [Pedobacter sp. KBW01]|uniref:recombinase family protein n=1 Tax=Pedobacter sp. KBW01 TaxID=2153364 RepID=UPI000F5A6D21|nr:recombinase family protein [Pedobacter sp. KBW01]RQO79473.1 recombinase family protein [Pedobacter sp. KBW01]
METAYLYVRVSTDEQKRKGYSLPEQEDRLLKYCECYNIVVKGVFREDFSAKDFNRPEWQRLIAIIRKKSNKEENNILFVKWDRFSRNIQYAYEMIGILRKYNTTAMAIDQPVDLTIPESSVMLAVYLSVPEAENTRRALNTANGIRRAKQLGRYPGKAPLGFVNLTAVDGKKIIAPRQPEASIIRWAFQQLGKNLYSNEEIRRMANAKGLRCSSSNFSKIIRNPVYCGLVPIKLNSQEQQMIKGIHEPLISQALFYDIQRIINTKRKITRSTDELKTMFFLTRFLVCPICGRKLCGSFSRGSTKRYPYYHCRGKCKTRINAHLLNDRYQQKLQELALSDKAAELFNRILEDSNINTEKVECLYERKIVLRQLEEQESFISKARKLFVADILKFDDYTELKREYRANSGGLKKELDDIRVKLRNIEKQRKLGGRSLIDIFQGYSNWGIADKKHLVSLFPPVKLDPQTGDFSLGMASGLSKILLLKVKSIYRYEFCR